MERHFSTGVATIVALMAAHRGAAGCAEAVGACRQKDVERINADLREEAAWPVAGGYPAWPAGPDPRP